MNKRIKATFCMALLLAAASVQAQQVLNTTLPDGGRSSDGLHRMAPASPKSADADRNPMLSEADRQAAGSLSGQGDLSILNILSNQNNRKAPIFRSPDAPEDDTRYEFRGINIAAGLVDETATSGMVNFNLKDGEGHWAFQCDTVFSNPLFSPYSFMQGNHFYCFTPQKNGGSINATLMTVFDAETMEQLRQETVTGIDQTRIPYTATYDEVNRRAYCITLGNTVNSVQPYYLNTIDSVTGRVQRLGTLCSYNGFDAQKNWNARGLVAVGGRLYGDISRTDGLWFVRINPVTLDITWLRRLDVSPYSPYGVQPMWWDENDQCIYLDYFDLYEGTKFVRLTFSGDDQVDYEVLFNAPTGYSYFYRLPATRRHAVRQMADVSDYTATSNADGTTLTLSFTVPATDRAGQPLTGSDVRLTVLLNASEVSAADIPATVAYGQQVSLTLPVSPSLWQTAVRLQPTDTDVEGTSCGQQIVTGYDAPEAVGNVRATLNAAGTTATILWNAPTGGRYADFGGNYDSQAAVTYDVVRNQDSLVVAQGITSRRVQDTNLPQEMGYYDYTVYAYNHGNRGAASVSPTITAGNYMPLPYVNHFDGISDMLGWTIINADNDGTARLWQWNQFSKTLWGSPSNGIQRNDDWAITPPFRMEASKLYEFSFDLSGMDRMDMTIGTQPTVAGQSDIVRQFYFPQAITDQRQYTYVVPDDDATYYLGLHDYGLSENISWNVDNIIVREVASLAAPAQVGGLAWASAPKGALSGTLSFTAPTQTISGDPLTNELTLRAYDRNDQLIGQQEGVAPGSAVALTVAAAAGYNQLRVVAVSDEGEGWPAVANAYVGPDQPRQVQQLKMNWMDDEEMVVNLNWEPSDAVGVNGGYVDQDALTYKIYQYDDSWLDQQTQSFYHLVASDITERDIDVTLYDSRGTRQNQYVLAVTAVNAQGESAYQRVGVVAGHPYELPFTEPWKQQGTAYSPWIVSSSADGQTSWTLDGDYYADVTAQNNDGCSLILVNSGTAEGKSSFQTPIISFADAKNPVFSFWVYNHAGMHDGAYVTVDAITNGADLETVAADTIRLGGNNGWTEYMVSLKPLVGKRAQVALTAYMPDPTTRIWSDNWSIREATGNDLALTQITQPFAPKNGDQYEVGVTVSNLGLTPAADYSVLFTVNGEVVAEATPDATLGVGERVNVSFPVSISAVQDELIYSAELLYDDDNQDNNLSAEVEVEARQVAGLMAPTGLTATGSGLQWEAPEAADGYATTLDFNDLPVFETGSDIAGWRNLDVDQFPTTTFLQYYGNYWPYANAPLGFMTWNVAQAGNALAEAWAGRGQSNCLVHFSDYGITPDGYATTGTDDWFISPLVKGGTEFAFWAKTVSQTSTIDIVCSTTDREPASFTQKLGTVTFGAISTWYESRFTLPADARYVAFHITNDQFGILIDDITYTQAEAPQLEGYRVYRGTEPVATVSTPQAAVAQNGTYRVTALYNLGESEPTDAVSFTDGISDTRLSSPQNAPRYYDLQGRRLPDARKGLNIVQTGQGTKVVVK